jgi:serine/threonine protein kinase/tetratricopeptide (TPR) repeat protein
MGNERWQRLEELFHLASELEDEDRHYFLEQACGQDEDLLRQIETMISQRGDAENFLESPPFGGSELLALCEEELNNPGDTDLTTMIGKTISHYRIVEMVGAGGMGTVYKAEDLKLGRFVALKFLSGIASDPGISNTLSTSGVPSAGQVLECLEREARASSALDHPNICTVYEVDEYKGSAFIAMQFLNGLTLADEIDGKPLTTERVIDLGIQIADALEAAHRAGIVHRDIKPKNIFVTQRKEAKILDFGLAKLGPRDTAAGEVVAEFAIPNRQPISLSGTLSRPGVAFGTVAYMSPEQVLGRELDARTDLFSLGVVLCEMATGSPPFTGQTPDGIFDGILHKAPASASLVNPAVTQDLQRVIDKALEKDCNKRYQTAAEMRDDLKRLQQRSAGTEIVREFPVQRRWAVAAVLLLVAAVPVIYGYLHQKQSTRFHEQDTIVLADFSNSTGEPLFDQALKQRLRVALEQSPFLNVLSDQKTSAELRFMGRSPDTLLTKDVTREVCLRVGGKAMLMGSISPLGSHYALGLDAVNCQDGDSLDSEQIEAESREKILSSLGEAAMRVRTKLGESLDSIRKYDAPAEQATTASLEALQAYALAIKTRSTAGEEAAFPFFKRATELDPGFAMAFARLGAAYATDNQPALASAALKKAYELRERVSERERLYIESHYFHTVTGEYDKAIQSYQLWQQNYPSDLVPYVNLGTLYGILGQHEKSLEEERQVLHLEPGLATGYFALASAYINLNQFDKARDAISQVDARKLDNPMFWETRCMLAFVEGDPAELKRQIAAAMTRSGSGAGVLAFQADTEAHHGRLSTARKFTRRAIESARDNGDPQSAIGYELVSELREADFGNLLQARRQIATLALGEDQSARTLGALASARAGDSKQALAIADDLSHEFPSDTLLKGYWLPTIRAAVELNRKDPSKAIELLETAIPYELGLPQTPTNVVPYPIYLRGLALLAAGQGPEAAVEFQKILDHTGIGGNYPLDALAHLGLARAYALQARIPENANCNISSERCSLSVVQLSREMLASASKAYQDFFALWKDADPDIPVLKQARTEFQRLAMLGNHFGAESSARHLRQ